MVIYAIVGIALLICGAYLYYRRKKMPAGMIINDASGELLYDLTNPSIFLFGQFTSLGQSGEYVNDKIVKGKTVLIPIRCEEESYSGYQKVYYVEDGKIRWESILVKWGNYTGIGRSYKTTFLVGGVMNG